MSLRGFTNQFIGFLIVAAAVSSCSLNAKIFHSKNSQLQTVAPSVSSVSPSAASTFGGATLTISGGGFQANTQVALTDGQPCLNVRVQTPTTLQCILPPHSQADTQIVVSTPGAGSASANFSFKNDLFTQVDFVAGSYTVEHLFAEGTGKAARIADVSQFASDGTYLYAGMGQTGAEYHIVAKIHIQSGQVSILSGLTNDTGGTGDGAFATAQFLEVSGITRVGRALYAADTGGSTIRKLDLDTQMVSTIAGQPQVPGITDGDGPTVAQFTSLGQITNDGQSLYVVDGCAIRKYDLTTHAVSTLLGVQGTCAYVDGSPPGARIMTSTGGIVFAAGRLYLSDNQCIREINPVTGEINAFVGKCAVGTVYGAPYADGIGPSATLYNPGGITTDGINLYIADGDVFTIRKVVISTGLVSTIAGNSTVYVPGTNDGPIGSALLSYPREIVYDPVQGLLISSGKSGATTNDVNALRRIH